MDVSSGEATDTDSPKIRNISKISKEPSSDQTGSPDVSPLSKSRYGRTRKPKISEDFYNIDVIFEATRESKRSPRNTQLKPPPPKIIKPKQNQSPNKPKDSLSSTSTRSPKVNTKSKRFVHVTGDDAIERTSPEPEPSFSSDLNPKAIHTFFNKDPGMSMLQNAEPKADTPVVDTKQKENALTNSDSITPLTEDLTLQSVDVTKVLKIISTRSPDLGNPDLKSSFKPLKTYSNKRKSFHKVGVVESFGLPDKPIFPLENEKSTEPKRIKNLDVAPPASESDINIVDKRLLDTPWKIASINTDIAESEMIESSIERDDDSYFTDTEFLSPVQLNSSASDQSLDVSKSADESEQVEVKTKMLPPESPKITRKQQQIEAVESQTTENSNKEAATSSKVDNNKVSEIKSPKKKTPRKQKQVVREDLSIQVLPPQPQDSKKSEESKKHEVNLSQARSPRKRKQVPPDPEESPTKPQVSNTPKPSKKQKGSLEDAKSPKNSPKKQKQVTQVTPEKSASTVSEAISSLKSPRKQRRSDALTDHKDKKSPQKLIKKQSSSTEEINKNAKDKEIKTPEAKVLKQVRKGLRSTESLTETPEESPTKTSPQKRKRSLSRKSLHAQSLEKLVDTPQENTTPTASRPRGRPRKYPVETTQLSASAPNLIKPDIKTNKLSSSTPNLVNRDTKTNKVQNADKSTASTKDTPSPVKKSARLSKQLPKVENISKEIKAELIDDDLSPELDEMNLLERKRLSDSPSRNPPAVLNTKTRRSGKDLNLEIKEISQEVDVKKEEESQDSIELNKSGRKRISKGKFIKPAAPAVDRNVPEVKDEDIKTELDDVKVKSESDAIELGDLMWARLRGFPYWPCLITEDPTTHEHKKNSFKKQPMMMYHVRFFGDRGRRSWVYSSALIHFTSKNDLKKLAEEIKNKSTTNVLMQQSCIVKSNIRPKWENATAEAESLRSSTIQERFDFFFNMFASEKEKRQRLLASGMSIADIKKLKAKTEHVSRSRVKSESSPTSRSKSLPVSVKNDSSEEGEGDLKTKHLKSKDDSEKLTVTKSIPTPEEQENKSKKLNNKNEPEKLILVESNSKVNLPLSIQKRASKINERQESKDSLLDESMDTFLKSPWQGIHVTKKRLGTPFNEANSECSLSDSDSLSKSSTNTVTNITVVTSSFKAQMMRQKRNNLFRGIPRDRVCQVCKQPGEIIKCKGPCSGIFHYKCGVDRYVNELTVTIKEEPDDDENASKEDTESNGTPDTTHMDAVEENDLNTKNDDETTNIKKNNIEKDPIPSKPEDQTQSDANNKVEIIYIDCDDSDFEHTLTPKVRLTPSVDFGAMSLSEQIDFKMKEIMQKLEKNTRYADSTTDYTSSEESSSNLLPPAEKPVQKKKSVKVKHITADHVSFASSASSSEDLLCESTNEDVNQDKNGPTAVKVTSSENSESKKEKDEKLPLTKDEELPVSRIEKHVTGDVTPQSETSNDLNFNKDDYKDFKCGYCIAEVEPPCFVCHKEVSNKDESFRQKCSLHKCGRFYHPGCLKMWPQTQWSLISKTKQKNSDKQFDTFVCPAHVCHTCSSDDPHAAVSRCPSDKVVKCLRCPATYHTTNYCVPAGTLILSTFQIVCPRHLGRVGTKGRPLKHSRTINTPWCFICSKGGELICCETCPTSVHTDCLAVNLMEDGTFMCEDCETGRFPLYDEIVWVKLGTYRWWPAVILFPNEIPTNIKNMPHKEGEFVVKFFGTHDHYWVSRGRVFLFQEGDKGHCSPTKRRVDASFKKSIEEAAMAHKTKKLFKSSKEAEIKTGMKPPPYIRVKVNRPVGNVRLFDGNISNTTSCECDPNQDFPCGPDSDCLNRLLLTECDPNICPAKEKCNNQRFEKRQYPPLVPYKTQARGWGLKTLAPIRKGDFVIEYVGEIIDEQEYQRRIRKMHEQKDENYYFLTIDKDRIIDAGPKGNLARFMNHCCQPNCETQKWTVNGDTRVGLFAMEDIPADAELTFNYNLECIGKEKKICKCGAPNCSGFIGQKAKPDESQKKPKKGSNIKKKKRSVTPQVFKNEGPCFVCGQNDSVGACHNKICTKFYHLKCVNLEFWPEGKWVCPWHNCNICTKRTIRCCVKCINSYCPVHSEGNVRYDKLLGFVCSEHDPTKESHEPSNQNLAVKNLKNSAVLTTEETDVTSTTSDEIDNNHTTQATEDVSDLQSVESVHLISTESVTSTPIKNKDISKFADTLREFESGTLDVREIPKLSIPEPQVHEKSKALVTGKRKRGRQKQSIGNASKKIKLSDQIINEGVTKPKPNFATPNLLDMPAQNEVKLSSSVPTRHLRTTRHNTTTNVENKRFLKQQSELEKDLPIRKRSRPRCEATL